MSHYQLLSCCHCCDWPLYKKVIGNFLFYPAFPRVRAFTQKRSWSWSQFILEAGLFARNDYNIWASITSLWKLWRVKIAELGLWLNQKKKKKKRGTGTEEIIALSSVETWRCRMRRKWVHCKSEVTPSISINSPQSFSFQYYSSCLNHAFVLLGCSLLVMELDNW